MIIRNISSKIISIGSILLKPDTEVEVAKKTTELPAVKAFVAKNWLVVSMGEKELSAQRKEAAERKAKAEAEAKAKAEARAKAEAEAKAKAEAEAAKAAQAEAATETVQG